MKKQTMITIIVIAIIAIIAIVGVVIVKTIIIQQMEVHL